ncbi:MAG: hypothetical protein Kow0096_22440 [Thiohalomonadaceae bacterium]
MSGTVTVRRAKTRRFGVVWDDILEARTLRPASRLVLAWATSRGDGWVIRIEAMRAILGISANGWATIKKELVDAGYFIQRREQAAGGKIQWVNEIYDSPIHPNPIDGEPMDGVPMGGNAMPGNEGGYQYDASNSKKTEEKKQQHASAAPAAKSRRKRRSGLVTWTPDDVTEAERLESENEDDVLRDACAAVQRNGKEPLPGRVARYLDQQQHIRQVAERQAAIDQRLAARPPVDEERVRDGLKLLPLTLRRRVASAAGTEEGTS